ncbi:ADP-ribosylation factor-like protein 6-interacting protein 4 isoform X2 [Vulpes vulpes]|uniref:ADP-ribosylation factor-like protein 6-interacting protein 4 n=1 Tax=Vulpes vulpes TaxID=9627 RepID=A0A3Q7TSV8_VULVU|nr:ADP-ribosylation factor-like protein 6-interacting protein 4 isoform X1 [Vulpes vulpes]
MKGAAVPGLGCTFAIQGFPFCNLEFCLPWEGGRIWEQSAGAEPRLPLWTGPWGTHHGGPRPGSMGGGGAAGARGGRPATRAGCGRGRGRGSQPGSPASLFGRCASQTPFLGLPGRRNPGLQDSRRRHLASQPDGPAAALSRPEVTSPPLPHGKARGGSQGPARWAAEEETEQLRGPSLGRRGRGGPRRYGSRQLPQALEEPKPLPGPRVGKEEEEEQQGRSEELLGFQMPRPQGHHRLLGRGGGDRKKRGKHKDKKRRKKKRKRKKHLKKKGKEKAKLQQQGEALPGPSLDQWHRSAEEEEDGPVLTDEQKSRIQAMKPMTKEEWDARQSIIRKVVDPETGRTRLIKGDGEVLEEIVTKERHREINKQATRGDGLAFQMRAGLLP